MTKQSYAHRDIKAKLDDIESQQEATAAGLHAKLDEQHVAVEDKLDNVEGKLGRALSAVIPELHDNTTPMERFTFYQNRRALDLNRMRDERNQMARQRSADKEAQAKAKSKGKATGRESRTTAATDAASSAATDAASSTTATTDAASSTTATMALVVATHDSVGGDRSSRPPSAAGPQTPPSAALS